MLQMIAPPAVCAVVPRATRSSENWARASVGRPGLFFLFTANEPHAQVGEGRVSGPFLMGGGGALPSLAHSSGTGTEPN